MSTTSTSRERHRFEVARRISDEARALADARGLGGFTLEDLAEAAGVSRRTLFNYFPGKVDAVLGPSPVVDERPLAVFRAGGPHRDLVEDLGVLAQSVLTDRAVRRADLALHRRLLGSSPRLLAAAHERLEVLCEQMVAEILVREGPLFDAVRARVAVRLLAAVTDTALDRFVDDPTGPPLASLMTDCLRTARELFG